MSLPLKFPRSESEKSLKSTFNEKGVDLVKIMMKKFLKKLKNQCLIRKKIKGYKLFRLELLIFKYLN